MPLYRSTSSRAVAFGPYSNMQSHLRLRLGHNFSQEAYIDDSCLHWRTEHAVLCLAAAQGFEVKRQWRV